MKKFQGFEFLFFLLWRNRQTNTRTTNTQSPQKGFLELKTAWYFCYSKKKKKEKKKEGLEEQKQKLLREKRCLRVSLTFSWYVSWWKILCCSSRRQRRLVCFRHQLSETLAHSPHALVTHRLPNHSQSHPPTHPHLDTHPHPHPPTPHHFPRITCTEISGSTMYSNLVWIMCCSLGFLKWYRSLYRTSAPAPTLSAGGRGKLGRRISLPGVDSSKLVFLSLLMFIFQSHISWGRVGEGLSFCSIRSKSSADYCRYDFVLEKYTVISESVGTCSRA